MAEKMTTGWSSKAKKRNILSKIGCNDKLDVLKVKRKIYSLLEFYFIPFHTEDVHNEIGTINIRKNIYYKEGKETAFEISF